jgi:two-component system chemotaxis response regulator CheB
MIKSKINVLIVDDSKVSRMLLSHLLASDPGIRVMDTVPDGKAALDFVSHTKPDVVLMDIHMPELDGFETTRRIMESQPVPIVICSATTDTKDAITAFRLMEAGAVACVEKPVGREHTDFEQLAENLLQTVKLMSEVKVVRRWPRSRNAGSPVVANQPKPGLNGTRLVGIGASTGGPPVLQTILSRLPKDFPAALLIVQHITRGFVPGLVEWLNQTTGWQIHVAAHEAIPLPGHAYFAPDDFHMGVSAEGRILLSREQPENSLRPAVSYLFRSLATTRGENAVGVLLTGMGVDGAAELKLMRDRGAITIAQDRESSVVHGMPGEAIQLGGAVHVAPADNIAQVLMTVLNHKRGF